MGVCFSRSLTTPASGQIPPHAAESGEPTAAPAAPMSRAEMERALNEWARGALGHENRIEAKNMILAYLDGQADDYPPRWLNLVALGLTSLPDCIGQLTNLETLWANANQPAHVKIVVA